MLHMDPKAKVFPKSPHLDSFMVLFPCLPFFPFLMVFTWMNSCDSPRSLNQGSSAAIAFSANLELVCKDVVLDHFRPSDYAASGKELLPSTAMLNCTTQSEGTTCHAWYLITLHHMSASRSYSKCLRPIPFSLYKKVNHSSHKKSTQDVTVPQILTPENFEGASSQNGSQTVCSRFHDRLLETILAECL